MGNTKWFESTTISEVGGHAPSSTRDIVDYHGQNSRSKPAYAQGSVAQGISMPPACAKCDRNHYGICREGSTSCLNCNQTGKFMKECPNNKQGGGNGGNRVESSSAAQPDRVAPKGETSRTGGGANRLYAITSCQEQENTPHVVLV